MFDKFHIFIIVCCVLVPCKAVLLEAYTADGALASSVTLPAEASQVVPFELADMLPGKYTGLLFFSRQCFTTEKVKRKRCNYCTITFTM